MTVKTSVKPDMYAMRLPLATGSNVVDLRVERVSICPVKRAPFKHEQRGGA